MSAHKNEYIISELLEFGIDTSIFKDILGDVSNKQECLKQLSKSKKMRPSETIYVGDTEHDIMIAKKTGILCIASTYGYRKKQQLLPFNPDYFINDFAQLKKIDKFVYNY